VVEDQSDPVEAYSILDLEGRAGIDLRKLDIERAEEVVLRHCRDWIASVRVLAVELHGERPTTLSLQALKGVMRQVVGQGEIAVLVRS